MELALLDEDAGDVGQVAGDPRARVAVDVGVYIERFPEEGERASVVAVVFFEESEVTERDGYVAVPYAEVLRSPSEGTCVPVAGAGIVGLEAVVAAEVVKLL